MLSVSGYDIGGVVHAGREVIVHRGRRLADNTPVLIKSPRSERPSRPAIARLRREQAILATLDDDRITRALELVPSSRGVALILEDIGGETLRRRCDEAPLGCAAFLDLALRITDALAALHSHGIAHRNLSPETILFEPGGRVSLTDFGVAGPSASAEASAGDVELSFAYIAPEQTGRLNRPVDQRSDLYSLGVVFFELMTGRPPFQHEDRLELVHSHIAREPPSPRALNPECPEAVAAIILKLLAKMADERYQSADGLRHDLDRCRERLGKDGAIAPFALGEHDRPPRLTFTDRLYGSEGLIHEFLAAFERASKGTREVVLFEGQTGAGKSQLLAEILHGHVAGRGQVLSARCDSDPDTPYAPLVAAHRGRLRELLSADDDELDLWRMQLAAAVGDGAALLGEPTAPAPELPKTEAAQRFRGLFDALLRGLATARTPFVVVVDDLQWIDPSSAGALARFFEDPRGYALILVAAYRGDNLATDHPLSDLRKRSAASGATVTHLNLTPLTIGDTVALLRDSLVPASASLRGLAEHVHGRTGGNPLYTRVLLETLHDEDKIRFDVDRGSWSWELGDDAPDTDLDALLRSRLDALPEATHAALGAAACIGPRFDLERLGKLIERGATEVAELLAPALDNGVLRSISEPYSPSLIYAFAHEGLAELALAVLDADALHSSHWRIGQLLLDDGAADDDRIFTAVSHLVRGFAGDDTRDPAQLARLTLAAGQRATLAGAYEAASRYMGQGVELMPASAWRSDHELMLKLHVGLAEARQLLGHFEVAEALFERALAETRSPLDRAELLALKIRREIGLRRFEDALKTGDAGLRLLGVKLPRRGTRTALTLELTRLRWRMRKRTPRHFLELPESLERRTFVAHTLLMYMTPAAYFSDFQLAAALLVRLVNLSLERGRTEVTAFGVAGYALILAATEGDYAGAREYAEIADELLELLPSPAIAPRVDLFVGLFILPWTRPLFDAKGRLERGYLRARERGDLTYASFCCNELAPLSFIAGTPLGRLQEQAADNAAFLRQVREFEGHAHATALVYFCRSLRGQTDEPRRLGDEPEEEAALLGAAARYYRTPAGFYIPLYKSILLYHVGEYAEAQIHLDAAAQVLTPMRAIPTRVDHDLFSALNLAERATQAAPQDRRKLAERIAVHYGRLAAWERSSAANFGGRARLAAAALAWAEGRTHAVLPELNAAIARAKEADDPHYEGLAAELAARFVVATDTDFLLEHYLAIAFDAYQRYGAIAKIGALRTAYGERNQQKDSTSRVPTETSTLVPIDGSGGKSLDLGTVIKATQALSGEIVLDRLLDTLVRIVMENAGARRCFLVLDHEDRLLVEAEGSVDPEKVEVLRSTPLEDQGNLPLSILKYVARSATTVVLDNAAQTGAFTKDPYVRQQSLKSVLCMPISHQNKVMGVLYLENNLATDVFTDDRLELLNQLAAQLAISVDNARLYESLDRAREQAVGADQKKTRFLMTMSHELRTPLNAIIGYTELIEEDLMDGVTDGFVDDLGSIQTAALRLERTLESALELSRIEAGTFEIDLEEVAVDELVRDVLSELRPALAASGNHLDVDVGNIGVILSDRLRLRYCLRSVLDNAIRFTEGGRVSLKIAADEDVAPATLEIVVSDNGIGISNEHMERIFEAFTQADDSTTRLFEGSGVSLAVTRHICVALGGSINAESKVGAGSRFTITLPLRRAAAVDLLPK